MRLHVGQVRLLQRVDGDPFRLHFVDEGPEPDEESFEVVLARLLDLGPVDGDVVENVVVASAEMREARPVAAAIIGNKHGSCVGAQEDMVWIVRIVGQAANIAAIRPQGGPLTGPNGRGAEQRDGH